MSAGLVKGIKVYPLEEAHEPVRAYGRRDLYKICLVSGHSILHYPERSLTINGTCLLLGNPHQPYSSEVVAGRQTGYACVVTEGYLRATNQLALLQRSPLCKISNAPVVALCAEQTAYFTHVFEQLLRAQAGEYAGAPEVLQAHVRQLLHASVRLHPPSHPRLFSCYCQPLDATSALPVRRRMRRPAGLGPA